MTDTVKPPNLSYEDFAKLDIRTGRVLAAESVPKSKKLLKLQVDFGPILGTRTVLAGIAQAEHYGKVVDGVWQDSALVGQGIVAVVNLMPRDMFGIMSHGMVLAATDENGKVFMISCGWLNPGSEVR